MSACKRVVPLGFNAYSSYLVHRVGRKQISQLVKSDGMVFVDTYALVRSLEVQGMPSKQAETITAAIAKVTQSAVSKTELQEIEMLEEAILSKFKSEIESSQEHHFSMLQLKTEKLRVDVEKMGNELAGELRHENKKLRGDVEKMANELRYEIEKGFGERRQEICALKAQWEAAKLEAIKYALISISTAGLAVLCLWQ